MLVDNGRSRFSAVSSRRFSLHPLRRVPERLSGLPQIGGHAYGCVYSGPIGTVLTPLDGWGNGTTCRTPPASAARAARCVPSASTSRGCRRRCAIGLPKRARCRRRATAGLPAAAVCGRAARVRSRLHNGRLAWRHGRWRATAGFDTCPATWPGGRITAHFPALAPRSFMHFGLEAAAAMT